MYSYKMKMKKMNMIGIIKHSKMRLVYTNNWFFHPSPTILLTRSFCTVDPGLVQLSSDIDYIYNELDGSIYGMTRDRLIFLHQKLVLGIYDLSPLQVYFVEKENLNIFLYLIVSECPDIAVSKLFGDDITCVITPSKDDVWVYMGLSLMLLRLSHGCLPKDGFRLINMVSPFYYSLQQMGKVDRLYKMDLMASLNIIPISLILDRVKPLVGDGFVYKLISSFLIIPIVDTDGNTRRDIHPPCGIPLAGEITMILFNIVLTDIFDRVFTKRFPGIAFYRFINEVFISTKENDEVHFDEKAGYELLEELGLVGKIESIGSGDDPLISYERMLIYLDSDSRVQVRDPPSFNL